LSAGVPVVSTELPNTVVLFTSAIIVSCIESGVNAIALCTAPVYFLCTISSTNSKVSDKIFVIVLYVVLGVNVSVTPFPTVTGADRVKDVPEIATTLKVPEAVAIELTVPEGPVILPVTVCPTLIFELDDAKVTAVLLLTVPLVVAVVVLPFAI
jgi:hypothetical protein